MFFTQPKCKLLGIRYIFVIRAKIIVCIADIYHLRTRTRLDFCYLRHVRDTEARAPETFTTRKLLLLTSNVLPNPFLIWQLPQPASAPDSPSTWEMIDAAARVQFLERSRLVTNLQSPSLSLTTGRHGPLSRFAFLSCHKMQQAEICTNPLSIMAQ